MVEILTKRIIGKALAILLFNDYCSSSVGFCFAQTAATTTSFVAFKEFSLSRSCQWSSIMTRGRRMTAVGVDGDWILGVCHEAMTNLGNHRR